MGGWSWMPKPPQAPDPEKTAQAQAQANIEATREANLLNNPNVNGPYGSMQYTIGPDGRPIRTETLSPAQQRLLDSNNQASQGGMDILNKYGMPAIEDAMKGGWTLPGGARTYAGAEDWQTDTGIDGAPAGQASINYGALGAMPSASDKTRQSVIDSIYGQGAKFLGKRFGQQRSDQDADMAAQGITRGSAAQIRESGNLADAEQSAYGDLADRAIQTGGAEASRQFGDAMAARGQGASEIESSGQFKNQSRQMFIDQVLANMGVRNNAMAQRSSERFQNAALENSGRAQNYSEMMQGKLMPINVMNALQSGAQVNSPSYQPYGGQGVDAAPIAQTTQNAYLGRQAGYNANMNLFGQALGAGASLYKS